MSKLFCQAAEEITVISIKIWHVSSVEMIAICQIWAGIWTQISLVCLLHLKSFSISHFKQSNIAQSDKLDISYKVTGLSYSILFPCHRLSLLSIPWKWYPSSQLVWTNASWHLSLQALPCLFSLLTTVFSCVVISFLKTWFGVHIHYRHFDNFSPANFFEEGPVFSPYTTSHSHWDMSSLPLFTVHIASKSLSV